MNSVRARLFFACKGKVREEVNPPGRGVERGLDFEKKRESPSGHLIFEASVWRIASWRIPCWFVKSLGMILGNKKAGTQIQYGGCFGSFSRTGCPKSFFPL